MTELAQAAAAPGLGELARRALARAYQPLDRAQDGLLRLKNFAAMAEQLLFLMLADRLLLPPRQRTTCLYSLMFYNVLAYCFGYLRELLAKEDWSPFVTLTETSQIKHLAMSATKIVLEWTKAVTFLVTVTFTLLVFSLGKGLQNYKPSVLYILVTWMYYAATEKVFVNMFPTLLAYLEFDALDRLENLYAPVILRIFTISMSGVFVLMLLPWASWRFLFVSTYLNVFLRSKELQTYWQALQKEREIVERYRVATEEDIQRFDDVCAVCLAPMKKARVTPCQHLFHSSCLRECLKTSDHCPLCKQELALE